MLLARAKYAWLLPATVLRQFQFDTFPKQVNRPERSSLVASQVLGTDKIFRLFHWRHLISVVYLKRLTHDIRLKQYQFCNVPKSSTLLLAPVRRVHTGWNAPISIFIVKSLVYIIQHYEAELLSHSSYTHVRAHVLGF